MADRVILPLAGVGVLVLEREAYEAALAAGATLARPATSLAIAPAAELLDSAQVAERLKLSPHWIEEATRQGRIPCIRFGRNVRYSLRDVVEAAKHLRRAGRNEE